MVPIGRREMPAWLAVQSAARAAAWYGGRRLCHKHVRHEAVALHGGAADDRGHPYCGVELALMSGWPADPATLSAAGYKGSPGPSRIPDWRCRPGTNPSR
jgi:hypothetical protein